MSLDGCMKLSRRSVKIFGLLLFFFAIGCFLRMPFIAISHNEGDEIIYQTLVDQISGTGEYSLQNSPVMANSFFIKSHYNTPLFFHPPMGIYVFHTFKIMFGRVGLFFAQLACFFLFYVAVQIAVYLYAGSSLLTAFIGGALAAFSPIVVQTNLKIWIDNPKIAFASLAFSMALLAYQQRSRLISVFSGVLFFAAVFTKLDAALMLPVAAWAIFSFGDFKKADSYRALIKYLIPPLCGVGVAILIWLIWSYMTTGSFFFGNPGRPSPELLANNGFIRYVTSERPFYYYLYAIPIVYPTLVWSIVALFFFRVREAWQMRSLVGSILLIAFVYTVLGYFGYSKLLRYVSLIAPLSAVLFTRFFSRVFRLSMLRPSWGSALYCGLGFLAFLGETFQGIKTALLFPKDALIRMFF